MKKYQDTTSIRKGQRGSVLLVALVFLTLTSLIAVTTMDTSILEVRMTGNQQFQEDAAQVAEGAITEIVLNQDITLPITSLSEDGLYCEAGDKGTNCEVFTLTVSPELRAALPAGATLYFTANRGGSAASAARGSAEDAGVDHKFYEVTSEYDGSGAGLSTISVTAGIDKQSLNFNSCAGCGGKSNTFGGNQTASGEGLTNRFF